MIIAFRLKDGDREVATCAKPEDIPTMKWMKTKTFSCAEAYNSANRMGGEVYLSDTPIDGWIDVTWDSYDRMYFYRAIHGYNVFYGHIEQAMLNIGFKPNKKTGIWGTSNKKIGAFANKMTKKEAENMVYGALDFDEAYKKYVEPPPPVAAKPEEVLKGQG